MTAALAHRDELTDLREQVRNLSERVAAMELGLSDHVSDLMLQGFTRSESIILGLLLTKRVVSRDAMMIALYGSLSDGDVPDTSVVSVFISKLRKKMREYGIEDLCISCVWGSGYSIPENSRTHIRQVLEWKHPTRPTKVSSA